MYVVCDGLCPSTLVLALELYQPHSIATSKLQKRTILIFILKMLLIVLEKQYAPLQAC
jgi:hypothetical protein